MPADLPPAGRELDQLAHTLLGPPWDESRCRVCGSECGDMIIVFWANESEEVNCTPKKCCEHPVPLVRADAPPAYSADPAAARLLKDEIERRGLQLQFTEGLLRIITTAGSEELRRMWADPGIGWGLLKDLWELLRATPEQITRAAILAARKAGESDG